MPELGVTEVIVRNEPIAYVKPFKNDPSTGITLHFTEEDKLAKISYQKGEKRQRSDFKDILNRCPICGEHKKLNTRKANPNTGDRMAAPKEVVPVYVAAHAGKLAQRGFQEVDARTGKTGAPIEQRYSTYLTIAASVLPIVAVWQKWLPDKYELPALVFGAQVSTTVQDYIEEVAPKTFRSPTFRARSLTQRQPAVPLSTGATENLVPTTPVAGF